MQYDFTDLSPDQRRKFERTAGGILRTLHLPKSPESLEQTLQVFDEKQSSHFHQELELAGITPEQVVNTLYRFFPGSGKTIRLSPKKGKMIMLPGGKHSLFTDVLVGQLLLAVAKLIK